VPGFIETRSVSTEISRDAGCVLTDNGQTDGRTDRRTTRKYDALA